MRTLLSCLGVFHPRRGSKTYSFLKKIKPTPDEMEQDEKQKEPHGGVEKEPCKKRKNYESDVEKQEPQKRRRAIVFRPKSDLNS